MSPKFLLPLLGWKTFAITLVLNLQNIFLIWISWSCAAFGRGCSSAFPAQDALLCNLTSWIEITALQEKGVSHAEPLSLRQLCLRAPRWGGWWSLSSLRTSSYALEQLCGVGGIACVKKCSPKSKESFLFAALYFLVLPTFLQTDGMVIMFQSKRQFSCEKEAMPGS